MASPYYGVLSCTLVVYVQTCVGLGCQLLKLWDTLHENPLFSAINSCSNLQALHV